MYARCSRGGFFHHRLSLSLSLSLSVSSLSRSLVLAATPIARPRGLLLLPLPLLLLAAAPLLTVVHVHVVVVDAFQSGVFSRVKQTSRVTVPKTAKRSVKNRCRRSSVTNRRSFSFTLALRPPSPSSSATLHLVFSSVRQRKIAESKTTAGSTGFPVVRSCRACVRACVRCVRVCVRARPRALSRSLHPELHRSCHLPVSKG